MEQKILIIEDEKELADILGEYLKVEGFQTVICNNGQTGLEAFYREEISLVLLDIMLPLVDGIMVCREIREKSKVPVIMLSAKSGEMDKVVALGIGADDYVTKPFSPLELVARVKAQMRRYNSASVQECAEKNMIKAGKLTLNRDSYEAHLNGKKLELTTKEFEILLLFAENPGQVFSKSQIYEQVWGYGGICDDNSVTVYINRIREKLGEQSYVNITTVWGAGYKMVIGV